MNLYKNHEGLTDGLTPDLWDTFPMERAQWDPGVGFFKLYRWIGDYILDSTTWEPVDFTVTQAGSGTVTPIAGTNGGMLIDTGATTNGQGMQLQHGGAAYIDFSTHKRVCLEMLCTPAAITTEPEFFFGLAVTDTSIIASDANSASDYVGLQTLSNTSALLTGVSKVASPSTTGSATLALTGATLVSDTAVKLGMEITPNGAKFFINGVLEADRLAASEISLVGMRPSLVLQSNGTTQPTLSCRWMAIGVE